MKVLALVWAHEGERRRELARPRGEQIVAGGELAPTRTATTVRVRGSETTVVDGPFAETREQLGGYYVLDVESMDEAAELAARFPSAAHGAVELRPAYAQEETP